MHSLTQTHEQPIPDYTHCSVLYILCEYSLQLYASREATTLQRQIHRPPLASTIKNKSNEKLFSSIFSSLYVPIFTTKTIVWTTPITDFVCIAYSTVAVVYSYCSYCLVLRYEYGLSASFICGLLHHVTELYGIAP